MHSAQRYALSDESRDLLRGYEGMLPQKKMKISLFIATTTKKNGKSVNGVWGYTPGKILKKTVQFGVF